MRFISFKAIITEGGEDDKHWLTFWSIYMVFNLLEEFGLKYIVNMFVIMGQSFYFEIKLAFIIWLMFLGGATTVFDMFVEPAMKKHSQKIDKAIKYANELSQEFKDTAFTEKVRTLLWCPQRFMVEFRHHIRPYLKFATIGRLHQAAWT